MDSFFGIGFPELVLILLLAGMVMGPQRIRQVARTLGRLVAQVQGISREFTRQLNAELDAIDNKEMRGTINDVNELRRQVAELQQQVRSIPAGLAGEGKRAAQEGQQHLRAKPGNGTPAASGDKAPAPGSEIPRPVSVADDPES